MKNDTDSVIENFKKIQPSEIQFQRWERVLRRARVKVHLYVFGGLAAGLLLGILASHLIISNDRFEEPDFSATFVQHSVKNL